MQRTDSTWLTERLAELAEALGARAPGSKAIQVWMDTLRECHPDDVRRALADWPKANTRMPAPADLLKTVRNHISDRVERAAKRAEGDGFDVERMRAATPAARAALAQIREILASPRPEPKEWARVILVRQECGERVDPICARLARVVVPSVDPG